MASAEYPIRDLKRMHATIHVTYTKEFRIRVWIARSLIRLAGWVLGCRVDVEKEEIDAGGRRGAVRVRGTLDERLVRDRPAPAATVDLVDDAVAGK